VANISKIQAGKLLTPTEEASHARAVARGGPVPCPPARRAPVCGCRGKLVPPRDQLAYDMMAKYNREKAIV
jgi:proline dehydrogenase